MRPPNAFGQKCLIVVFAKKKKKSATWPTFHFRSRSKNIFWQAIIDCVSFPDDYPKMTSDEWNEKIIERFFAFSRLSLKRNPRNVLIRKEEGNVYLLRIQQWCICIIRCSGAFCLTWFLKKEASLNLRTSFFVHSFMCI